MPLTNRRDRPPHRETPFIPRPNSTPRDSPTSKYLRRRPTEVARQIIREQILVSLVLPLASPRVGFPDAGSNKSAPVETNAHPWTSIQNKNRMPKMKPCMFTSYLFLG